MRRGDNWNNELCKILNGIECEQIRKKERNNKNEGEYTNKKYSLIIAALLLFAVLAGIGHAIAPPPPPAPAPQAIGIYDTCYCNLTTNTTDQSACRSCHQSSGTISNGYSNLTLGGVDSRHHYLVAHGKINPYTNKTFECQDCHPTIPNGGVLLPRSCKDCHNGTDWWGNALGGRVGNFPRPHHVSTGYDSASIDEPAQNRQCNFCHGSFVDNYNDGHYIPPYNTDFMITPYATFKATNFSQPNPPNLYNSNDLQVLNKTWGGCESCHLGYPLATPWPLCTNRKTHHADILGYPIGDIIQFSSTPGVQCYWCHASSYDAGGVPYIFNTTNSFNGEILINAMEVRNSTVEQDDFVHKRFDGTTNVSIYGAGCEKCHSVRSLHNIQFNYSQNGPQGMGHINNNTDCSGCHNSWVPLNTFVPGPIVPTLDNVSPSVIAVGTPTTLNITGSDFVNPDGNYTSVVKIDGVIYTPTSLTATQIIVNIPGLNAGVHLLQVVKNGDTTSKLETLTVVLNPTLTSATMVSSKTGIITLTLSGQGFGATKPNSTLSVSVNHSGNQIASTTLTKWTDRQIVAKFPAGSIASGDIAIVVLPSGGEAQNTIS